jgi:hypothetical protein
MNFLSEVSQIDQSVKSGELNQSGMLPMPAVGEAILFAVEADNREGRNYLQFYMTLPGSTDYRRWDVRCPSTGDADNAKWMGMQNIYNTLFGVMKRDPKAMLVDKCFEELTNALKEKSIRIQYTTEETTYIGQKGKNAGKEVKSSFLRTITGISMVAKVSMDIKPKTPPPAANSNWGQPAGGGFGGSEEVPF